MEDDEFLGPDAALPEVRVEWGIARAQFASEGMNRSAADLFGTIADTLSEAHDHPEVWVGPGLHSVPTDVREFAMRAAVLDISIRLGISENTVRSHAQIATTMRSRAPKVWLEFVDGQASVANVRSVSESAATLPDLPSPTDFASEEEFRDATTTVRAIWARFDAELADAAVQLTPPRFRTKVRAVREQVLPRSLDERHQEVKAARRFWVEHDIDGMAWINLHVPSDVAHRASVHVDASAERLAARADETRTLAQLRADVAGDLLMGGSPAAGGVGATVAVTIPMLSLLGLEDLPATLDGMIPIPASTARELTALAPSLRRLLTDPVTSAVLDLDTTQYRPTADLKRMVRLTSPLCAAPGCGRRAKDCDIDHIVAREHHGPTNFQNLTPLCRGHHRLKHVSRWRLDRTATGALTWTSPTGNTRTADPPPF